MSGKRSNGEGSVIYDKRRETYRARVTEGWEFNEETEKSKQIVKNLGTFKTKGEASRALAEYLKNPFNIDDKDVTFSQIYQRWYDEFMTQENASYEYRVKSAYKYCSSIYNKKIRDINVLDMKSCIYKGTIISTRRKNTQLQRRES